jgi:hypothetical protein
MKINFLCAKSIMILLTIIIFSSGGLESKIMVLVLNGLIRMHSIIIIGIRMNLKIMRERNLCNDAFIW